MPSLAAVVHTQADFRVKGALQEAMAHRMWFFLAGLIGLATLVNWTSKALAAFSSPRPSTSAADVEGKNAAGKDSRSLRRFPSALAASFRTFAYRYGLPTAFGNTILFSELGFIATYIVVTFILLFVKSDHLDLWWYEDRAAHLATIQLPLIVALAGKNNVLSFLTGVSHEKLNILHRASARTCLILLWIHFLSRYTSGLPARFDFSHGWMQAGALGISAFSLAAVLSMRPIRQKAYEFFLVSHIMLILIFLVAGYYHTKDPGYNTYIWPAFVIWAFDRLVRVVRILINNTIWRGVKDEHSHGTVELITEDTIKLTLRRPMNWKAGQHAYILLPSVSTLPTEAHPFSISTIPGALDGSVSAKEKDVTFLIRTRAGFTGRMRAQALKAGKFSVPAFIDGPYGSPPDLSRYSTNILVSGGSGVSYTLPLLLQQVHLANTHKTRVSRVVFVWIVRSRAHIAWILPTLESALVAAPAGLILDLQIHVTGHTEHIESETVIEKNEKNDSDSENVHAIDSPVVDERIHASSFASLLTPRTVHGRPNLAAILREEIGNARGPVSVDVSGPTALAESVRVALRSEGGLGVLKGRAPVTLHVETFGM